jgi:hypothetical protein
MLFNLMRSSAFNQVSDWKKQAIGGLKECLRASMDGMMRRMKIKLKNCRGMEIQMPDEGIDRLLS